MLERILNWPQNLKAGPQGFKILESQNDVMSVKYFNKTYFVHAKVLNTSERSWFPLAERAFSGEGKVGKFYLKCWKNLKNYTGKLEKKYWKSKGKLSPSDSINPANMVPHLYKKRTSENTGKLRKILEKSGKFVILNKWEP